MQRLFLIDLFGIEHRFGDDLEALRCHLAVEATSVANVTGGFADLGDLQQDCVPIAIEVNGVDLLHVTALLTFSPQLIAAAAEVHGATRLKRLGVALGVHVRHHQDVARRSILGNGRQEPATLFKIWLAIVVYHNVSRSKCPMESTAWP